MESKLLKEILAITVLSAIIALTFNSFSDKGIPVIRKTVELNWENDTAINNYIKKDSLPAVSNKKTTAEENKKSESLLPTANEHSKKDSTKIVAGIDQKITKSGKDTISNTTPAVINKTESPEISKVITPTAITVDQAYKLYNNGVTFLDARIEADYSMGHIKGAIHMPLKKIDQYISKISHLSKDAFLVCYCDGSGCDLSIDLAKKLSELGYKNVKIFYSGWNDWKEKNYPME